MGRNISALLFFGVQLRGTPSDEDFDYEGEDVAERAPSLDSQLCALEDGDLEGSCYGKDTIDHFRDSGKYDVPEELEVIITGWDQDLRVYLVYKPLLFETGAGEDLEPDLHNHEQKDLRRPEELFERFFTSVGLEYPAPRWYLGCLNF